MNENKGKIFFTVDLKALVEIRKYYINFTKILASKLIRKEKNYASFEPYLSSWSLSQVKHFLEQKKTNKKG